MLCSQCKAQIPEDSVFCSNCGARLEREVPPSGPPPGTVAAGPPAPQVATKETLRSRYLGVPAVSSVLFVLGCVTAIFGLFVAIGVATIDELELSQGQRLFFFFCILYLFWMVAFTLLAYAYMVRLLSDIERRLAGSGSSSRVGR
jgi:hypothetical protein